ncbi:MAG: hypothetical protein AAGJ85_02700, partial [Pseudomonadota bacterium]
MSVLLLFAQAMFLILVGLVMIQCWQARRLERTQPMRIGFGIVAALILSLSFIPELWEAHLVMQGIEPVW